MACRGCANLQCGCFAASSDTVTNRGNGSQYAPFTFRPDNLPSPRPFGVMYGNVDQNLDNATYTGFAATTPDIDLGGNMITGNATSLTCRFDGIHIIGIQTISAGQAVADLNDEFTIRRNGSKVSTITFAHTASVFAGQAIFMSTTTLLDLRVGDTLDLFIDRVSGAGNVVIDTTATGVGSVPRLWAVWMGGKIQWLRVVVVVAT